MGEILRRLCKYKGVEIIEGHLMNMLMSIPLKISVSSFMGYLKEKSALMLSDKHANLKYKIGNMHFWSDKYSKIEWSDNKEVYTGTGKAGYSKR